MEEAGNSHVSDRSMSPSSFVGAVVPTKIGNALKAWRAKIYDFFRISFSNYRELIDHMRKLDKFI